MSWLSYVLTVLVIYPISRLPFRLLYGFSTLVYIVLYHVIGYRKQVVYANLQRVFPDRSSEAIAAMARDFYRHLGDMLLEGFKAFTISRKALEARMVFTNPSLVNKYYEEGRHVVLISAHYANWEYLPPILSMQLSHTIMGIYKPLANPYFDGWAQRSRSRFGDLVLVPMKQVKELFAAYAHAPMAMAFIADQSPSRHAKAYWQRFLGVDTAMLFGPEYYAKLYDAVVLYGRTRKVGRGHYTFTFEVITETPKETPDGFITKAHSRILEEQIKEEPALWLWSHKRWKLQRADD